MKLTLCRHYKVLCFDCQLNKIKFYGLKSKADKYRSSQVWTIIWHIDTRPPTVGNNHFAPTSFMDTIIRLELKQALSTMNNRVTSLSWKTWKPGKVSYLCFGALISSALTGKESYLLFGALIRSRNSISACFLHSLPSWNAESRLFYDLKW